jgi:hypothetical protein
MKLNCPEYTNAINQSLVDADLIFSKLGFERIPCVCQSNRNSYSHYIWLCKNNKEYQIKISDHFNSNKSDNNIGTIISNDGYFKIEETLLSILRIL